MADTKIQAYKTRHLSVSFNFVNTASQVNSNRSNSPSQCLGKFSELAL